MAYLCCAIALGSLPFQQKVVVTDASLSGWGAVWNHRTVRGKTFSFEVGQHIYGPSYEGPGGHQICSISAGGSETTSVGTYPFGQSQGYASARNAESWCGYDVQSETTCNRVETQPSCSQDDLGQVLQRLIALPRAQLPLRANRSFGKGRTRSLLSGVCLPSTFVAQLNNLQDRLQQSLSIAGGSILPGEGLVPYSMILRQLNGVCVSLPQRKDFLSQSGVSILQPRPGRLGLYYTCDP